MSNQESLASESLGAGLKLCDEWDIQVQRHPRKKKQMPSEKAKSGASLQKKKWWK